MEQQLILDRYRPLEFLGEGGFGSVVLAWDTRMQRRVAIKRLPLPRDSRGVAHRPPGLAEARTAAMLNHPNVVTVFDFDTDSDEAFLVMEHVDGLTLCDLLDDLDGPLELDESAAVIDAVASALEFAHGNGVLHLDVKPENVLVTRDGRVKVADFGMAELSTASGHGPAWGGTLGYMPIEQLEGGNVTERTDQWALGALAYELLTGYNPFDASTPDMAAEVLETVSPEPLSALNRHVPPEADAVVAQALALNPRDRHADVTAFADELVPLLGDPTAGRELLAELVEAYAEEPPLDRDEVPPGIGLWDLLGGRFGRGLIRTIAAGESGWLAWAGLAPFALEPAPYWIAIAFVALAALLAPSLGVLLGLACFVVGLFATGLWPLGVVVALIVGAWWWFLGRRSAGAAVLPLSAPVLGIVRMPLAMPLLAGFALPAVSAAVTALLGGILAMLASAVSAKGAPYLVVFAPYALDIWGTELALGSVIRLVLSPAAYIALAGWPLSAAAMSWACARATKGWAMIGAVLGSGVLAGAYALADQISVALYERSGDAAAALGEPARYSDATTIVALGSSLILVVMVAAFGAPVRAEEEG